MATVLLVNTFAFVFELVSIPAVEFLKTSARLSAQEDIAAYKKSVVVIETGDSKGTGFSISSEGTIMTNYHVIEGNGQVTVSFPDDGRYVAKVTETYPAIDIALLEADGEGLPIWNWRNSRTIRKANRLHSSAIHSASQVLRMKDR